MLFVRRQPLIMPNVRIGAVLALRNLGLSAVAAVISLALYALCLYFWRQEYDARSELT
jgi:hypothetical protein